MRMMLKSKIHRATITHTELNYEGSIGIDAQLMAAADLLPYEQVHILDLANGARFETYVIEEPPDSGRIAIYGAAARLVEKGDLIIILSYAAMTESEAHSVHPRIVTVDKRNAPLRAPAAVSG